MSIRGIIDAISQTKTGSHCALTLGKKAAGFVDESMAKWLLSRFPILQRRQLRDICLEVIGDLDEFFLRVERHLQDDARLPPANPEMMGLRTDPFGPELARVPRTLALPLGLLMAGVHVNGLAGNDMWLARRSITHGSFAGYLDTLAGGLIKADQPMESCLWEEAWQESGATRRDVVRIHAGPTYRYWSSTDAGIA